MAISMPLLSHQRVLAAKIETTDGTPIALAAANATFNVFNPVITEEVPENAREGQGTSFDPLPSVMGARSARLTFRTEIHGNGATGVPAWASTFLPACGMALTGSTYGWSSGSASAVTLTLGLYEDGVLRQLAGAVGTFTVDLTAGSQGFIDWDFLGVLQAETDVAILAPTYPTVIPPRFADVTVTFGGTEFCMSKITIAAGNEMKLRECPGHVSGYKSGVIVNRRSRITADPEASTVATRNWQSLMFAGTTEAISIEVGQSANNTVTFAAPVAQPVAKRRGDRGGINTNEVEWVLARNAAAGDDSLTAAFG